MQLSLRTANPYLLVAAVRQELRTAGVDSKKIGEFTAEAFAGEESQLRQTCASWVETSRASEDASEIDLE